MSFGRRRDVANNDAHASDKRARAQQTRSVCVCVAGVGKPCLFCLYNIAKGVTRANEFAKHAWIHVTDSRQCERVNFLIVR